MVSLPALVLQPVLVIERSHLTLPTIVAKAKAGKLTDAVVDRIKHQALCPERWAISEPTIYVLEPCDVQIYLARSMNHGHYQMTRGDAEKMRVGVKWLRQSNPRCNVTMVVVAGSSDGYRDDFITVMNNPNLECLSRFDQDIICGLVDGRKPDATRNNAFVDYGYAGARNSRRDAEFLGITHSNIHVGTDQEVVKDLFGAMSSLIREAFPDSVDSIYADLERNRLWSSLIEEGNIVEALRVGQTNGTNTLLRIHWDTENCTSSLYAWVCTISWLTECCKTQKVARRAVITYGKGCACTHMQDRKKHEKALFVLGRLYDDLPDIQKRADVSVYPPDGVDRKEYDFAFLDKGIFYSLFASGIQAVFKRYPIWRDNLLMACALWVNVVMSESPDHFWRICEDIVLDERTISAEPITKLHPYQVGYGFACELFRRKHTRSYPVKQRHAPAVNRAPTREQVENSMNALASLVRETQVKVDWNTANTLNYYGKCVEVLVEDSYGAGHLTSQHLIGVGSILKLLPASMLGVAEIGTTTRTWKFLSWAFGYSALTVHHDMNILLRALSVYKDISMLQSEELCCYLCKVLSPRTANYNAVPCCIDFDSVVLQVRRSRGTGDVIYRSMSMFYLDKANEVRCIDCNGAERMAVPLLSDDVMHKATAETTASFWSRKFKNRSCFHYKRASGKATVTDIRQYFAYGDPDDEALQTKRKPRKGSAGCSTVVASHQLLGPSVFSVCCYPEGREPLNMRQLVWTAVHGDGPYRSCMVVIDDRSDFLYCRGAREELVKVKRFGMHTVSLRMKGTSKRFVPDPYFPMYTNGMNDDEVVPRKRNSNGRTKRKHDMSLVFDDGCPWNYSRVLQAADGVCRRWFARKRDAVDFALWCFFFHHLHLFDRSNTQVRSLLFMGNVKEGGRFGSRAMEAKQLRVQGTSEVHVYYDMLENRRKEKNPNPNPRFVAIAYPQGGRAYYLCNDAGQRISGAMLKCPAGNARQSGDRSKKHGFDCIIKHVDGAERASVFPRNPVNLLVRWCTQEITEEPLSVIFEDCAVEVVAYARRQNVLGKAGWNRVAALSLVLGGEGAGEEPWKAEPSSTGSTKQRRKKVRGADTKRVHFAL